MATLPVPAAWVREQALATARHIVRSRIGKNACDTNLLSSAALRIHHPKFRQALLLAGAASLNSHRRLLSNGISSTGTDAKYGLDKNKEHPRTGGLKKLMHIPPVEEMLGTARKAALLIQPDMDLRSPKERSRRLATQRLHEFAKALTKPLGEMVETYSNFQPHLHPFEKVVARLVITARQRNGKEDNLEELLKQVKELRKLTSAYASEASHEATKAKTSKEADDIRSSATQKIYQLWEDREHVMKNLQLFVRDLRSVPVLDESMSSVVLVGCPNVGKSSIVRLISSGLPEVANYPFTTRGLSMGHMSHDSYGTVCQVMDTPGLLAREEDARNAMEELTLAAIEHTKAVVIFVLDPTGTSGHKSSVKNQLIVRSYLRTKFPDSHWIDVLSKSDLPRCWEDNGVEFEIPKDAIPVSCKLGSGKEDLIRKVFERVFPLTQKF